MLTPAACHQTLLQFLLRDPPLGRVRLVARLEDELVANPDARTLHLFIPDLHLVSDEQLVRYSYHFNEWETFYKMLFRVQDARKAVEQQGNALEVIHLGDLYDLWREGTQLPTPIIEDHVNLVGMLYRHNAGLRARLLVGNHDAEMIGTPQFFLRVFLPNDAAGAFCLVVHGDWFDPIERLPDWLQRFGVYFAGPVPQAQEYPLGEVRDVLRRQAGAADAFQARIRLRVPAPLGRLRGIRQTEASLPRAEKVSGTFFLPCAECGVAFAETQGGLCRC
jgi:hypothetical protein